MRGITTWALGTLVLAALAMPAVDARAAGRAEFSLRLSERRPATATGLELRIVHRDPARPDGKPPAVDENRIAVPAGTRIDDAALPRCTATDAQFRLSGRAACPPGSRVGRGSISLMIGIGAPLDPFATEVTLFNGEGQLIELVSAPGTDATLAVDRAKIENGTITAAPPALPGGPPDLRTAIRRVDLVIDPVRGPGGAYLTTPPGCPPEQAWTSTGTFTYADGVRERVDSASPCTASAPGPAPMQVSARQIGTSRLVVVRVRSAERRCRSGVTVRIGGRRVVTRSSGGARLRLRSWRTGRRRVTAFAPGCVTARTHLRLREPPRPGGRQRG